MARTPVAGVHEAGQTQWTTTDGTQLLVADVGFEFTNLPNGVSGVNGLSGANGLTGDGWTNTGTLATQNGHTYAVWHNSTAQALIDQQVMTAAYVL